MAEAKDAGFRFSRLIVLVLATFIFAGVAATTIAETVEAPPLGRVTDAQTKKLRAQISARRERLEARLEQIARMPRHGVGRSRAIALLETSFVNGVGSMKAPLDGVDVVKFVNRTTAIVDGDSVVKPGEHAPARALLTSTLPLRSEGENGKLAPVDFGLTRTADGSLEQVQGLTPVTIPAKLGDGISVDGESGLTLSLPGSPDGISPSIVAQGDAAMYPNVATDTDFIVTPTPSGIETFTQLRSAQSPTQQTLSLDVPEGAVIENQEDGGAKVLRDGATVAEVSAPLAFDAAGTAVPVTMSVDGDDLILAADVPADAIYPVLVDPTLTTTFDWLPTGGGYEGHDGWTSSAVGTNSYFFSEASDGLYVTDLPGSYSAGSMGTWIYRVPRYVADVAATGNPPTSFMQGLALTGLKFSGTASNPAMLAGTVKEGVGLNGVTGYALSPTSTYTYSMLNLDPTIKTTFFGMSSLFAAATITYPGTARMGGATVVFGDDGNPGFGSVSSTGWTDTTFKPISFSASDSGLGVAGVIALGDGDTPMIHPNWSQKSDSTSGNCAGTVVSPCPRTFASSDAISYNPSAMPTGIESITLTAIDPVNNMSTSAVARIKVDHQDPVLGPIAGTIDLADGTHEPRPSYTVDLNSSDGATGPPQSGVASLEVKVDGSVVKTFNNTCTGDNCALVKTWTLDASDYSDGSHTLSVVATDKVGRKSAPRTKAFVIGQDTTDPELLISGPLFDAPKGWVDQGSYSLTVDSSDAGYGVTLARIKVDGQDVADSETFREQTCLLGACDLEAVLTLDTSEFEGGAHDLEVMVEDGAGNAASEHWTMNVNPAGSQVPVEEVVQTLDALDETSEVTTVGPPTYDPNYEGSIPGVGLLDEDGQAVSAGGVVPVSVDPENDGTLVTEVPTMDVSEEDVDRLSETPTEISLTPVNADFDQGSVTIDDPGMVVANTKSQVDTVVRPLYDGAMVFQVIRSADSPENYSWEVNVGDDQQLYQAPGDTQSVQVLYDDGSAAMTIVAEPAHDAKGASVPTDLTLEPGNTITLHVDHRASAYVYPVVAGPGWQAAVATSYGSSVETIDPTPLEAGDIDPDPFDQVAENGVFFGAPEPAYGDEAWVSGGCSRKLSSSCPKTRRYAFFRCDMMSVVDPGSRSRKVCTLTVEPGISVMLVVYGKFTYRYGKWVKVKYDDYHVRVGGADREATTKGPHPIGNYLVGPNYTSYRQDYPEQLYAYGSVGRRFGRTWDCFKMVGILPTRPPNQGIFPSRDSELQQKFSNLWRWTNANRGLGTYEQGCNEFTKRWQADG